jgi:hypothetical protein
VSDYRDVKADFEDLRSHRRDKMARQPQIPIQPLPDETFLQRVGRIAAQFIAGALANAILMLLAPLNLMLGAFYLAFAVLIIPLITAGMVTLVGRYGFRRPGSFALAAIGSLIGMALVTVAIGIAFGPSMLVLYAIVPPLLGSLAYASRWKPLYQRKKKTDEQSK